MRQITGGAMAKTIKLDDMVHKDLEAILLKRETFSQAVARLLHLHDEVIGLFLGYCSGHASAPKKEK
jgi:hypothetical protein